MCKFCEETFGEGQELLILTTELTINKHCAEFIAANGCAEYYNHNKDLLFYERQAALMKDIEMLEL